MEEDELFEEEEDEYVEDGEEEVGHVEDDGFSLVLRLELKRG